MDSTVTVQVEVESEPMENQAEMAEKFFLENINSEEENDVKATTMIKVEIPPPNYTKHSTIPMIAEPEKEIVKASTTMIQVQIPSRTNTKKSAIAKQHVEECVLTPAPAMSHVPAEKVISTNSVVQDQPEMNMDNSTEENTPQDYFYQFGTPEEMIAKFRQLSGDYSWRKVQGDRSTIKKVTGEELLKFLKSKKCIKWTSREGSGSGIFLKFDGIPFINVGRRQMWLCDQGPDIDIKRKQKNQVEKMEKIKNMGENQTRVVNRISKKQNCPATAEMMYIVKLHNYKIYGDSNNRRRTAGEDFRMRLKRFDAAAADRSCTHVFLLKMSHPTKHKEHIVFKHKVPKPLKLEDTNEMDISSPHRLSNVRHFKKWRAFGISAIESPNNVEEILTFGADVQNFQSACDIWFKDGGKYFVTGENDSLKLLVVLQTAWQQRLLPLYGQEIVFISNSRNTTCHNLTLFFIRIETNVCQLTVGAFIIPEEDPIHIQEALSMIKMWNPSWNVQNVIVDYSQAQISAIENTFPDCKVLISEKDCRQTWTSFLRQDKQLCHKTDEILHILNKIASSPTEFQYKASVKILKNSDFWVYNPQFQEYYNKNWESVHEKWVHCFRNLIYHGPFDDETENNNAWLDLTLLPGYNDCSLNDLGNILINKYFKNNYNKYKSENFQCTTRRRNYGHHTPNFLHNRPKRFVKHIMKNLYCDIDTTKVVQTSPLEFKVPSESNLNKVHEISLGGQTEMPSCTCNGWIKCKWPCKHLLAVISSEHCYWEQLNGDYRRNVLFILDSEIVEKKYVVIEE